MKKILLIAILLTIAGTVSAEMGLEEMVNEFIQTKDDVLFWNIMDVIYKIIADIKSYL